MSADNGIYIAKHDGIYYVFEGGAIENLEYYPVGDPKRKEEWEFYTKHSLHASNAETAINMAEDMLKEYKYVEYGIVYLGDYSV